jgi:antitoxin ChpS
MHTTHLRKVGGSTMLAVPPALLDILNLQAGTTVAISVEGDRLVIEPQPRPHYTLDELLAQCDPHAELSTEDRDWTQGFAVGGEII